MTALPHEPLITVEEYLELDRASTDVRYEYYNGYVRMMAGGTLDHATIGQNIVRTLWGLLRGSPCRVFSSDARVRLSETLYVYPDVTVTCDERDRGKVDAIEHPRLIVEVLSPSTEGFDRGKKFAYYRSCATIQEYVLVNVDFQAVEVYRRGRNDLWIYQVFDSGKHIELNSLEGVRFPVAAVYEDVLFSDDGNSPA